MQIYSCSQCPKYFESEVQLSSHVRLRHKQLGLSMNKLTYSAKRIDCDSQVPTNPNSTTPDFSPNDLNSRAWLSSPGSLLAQVEAYQDLLLANRRSTSQDEYSSRVNSFNDEQREHDIKRKRTKEEGERKEVNEQHLDRLKMVERNNVCHEEGSIRLKGEEEGGEEGDLRLRKSIRNRLTTLGQTLGQLSRDISSFGIVEVVDNKSRDNLLKDVIEKLYDPNGCCLSISASIIDDDEKGDEHNSGNKMDSSSSNNDDDTATNKENNNKNCHDSHNEIKGGPKEDKKGCCQCCPLSLSSKNLDELESSFDGSSLLWHVIKSIKWQTILNAANLGSMVENLESKQLDKEEQERKSSVKFHSYISIGGYNNNFATNSDGHRSKSDRSEGSNSGSSSNNNRDTNHRLGFNGKAQQIERLKIGVLSQEKCWNQNEPESKYIESRGATDVPAGSYRSISVTRRDGQELINCQKARKEEEAGVGEREEIGIDGERDDARWRERGESLQLKSPSRSCCPLARPKQARGPRLVGEAKEVITLVSAVKGHNLGEGGSKIYQPRMAPDGKAATNNHFIHYHEFANNNNKEALTQFTSPRSDHSQDELVGGTSLLRTNQSNGSELNSRHEHVVGSKYTFAERERLEEEEGDGSTRGREDSKSAASQSLKVAKFETPTQASSSSLSRDLAQEKLLSSSHSLPRASSNSIRCLCHPTATRKLEAESRKCDVCCCPALGLSVVTLKSDSSQNEPVEKVGEDGDKSMRLKSASQVAVVVTRERPALGNSKESELLLLLLVPCCDVTEREKGNESQEREGRSAGVPDYSRCGPFESEKKLLVNANSRCLEGENLGQTIAEEELPLSGSTVVMGKISSIESHNGLVQLKTTASTTTTTAAAMKQEVDKDRKQSNSSQQDSEFNLEQRSEAEVKPERSLEPIEGEDSDNLFRESREYKPEPELELETMPVASEQGSQSGVVCGRTSFGNENKTASSVYTIATNTTLASSSSSPSSSTASEAIFDGDNYSKHEESTESRPVKASSPVLNKFNNNNEFVGTLNMELGENNAGDASMTALQVCESLPDAIYSSSVELELPNSSASAVSELDQEQCASNISVGTNVTGSRQKQQSDKQEGRKARQCWPRDKDTVVGGVELAQKLGPLVKPNCGFLAWEQVSLGAKTDSLTENTIVKDSRKAWQDSFKSRLKSCELETSEKIQPEAGSSEDEQSEIESARERLLNSASFERSSLIDCCKEAAVEPRDLHLDSYLEDLAHVERNFVLNQQSECASDLVTVGQNEEEKGNKKEKSENFSSESPPLDAAVDNLKNGTQSECRSLVRDDRVESEAINECGSSKFKSEFEFEFESKLRFESESESGLKSSPVKAELGKHKCRAELLDRVSWLQKSTDCEDKLNTGANLGASQLSLGGSKARKLMATSEARIESIERDSVALSQLPKQSICFEAGSDETSIEMEASIMHEAASEFGQGRQEGSLVSGESNDACNIESTLVSGEPDSCRSMEERSKVVAAAVAKGDCFDLAKNGKKSMARLYRAQTAAPQMEIAEGDKETCESDHTNRSQFREQEEQQLDAVGIKVGQSESTVSGSVADQRHHHHCRMARSDKFGSIEYTLSPQEPAFSKEQVANLEKETLASTELALSGMLEIISPNQNTDTQTLASSSGEDALGKDETSGFNEKQRANTKGEKDEDDGNSNKGSGGVRDDAESTSLPGAIVIATNNNNDGDELARERRRRLEEKSNKNETCTFSTLAPRSSPPSSSTLLPQSEATNVSLLDDTQYTSKEYYSGISHGQSSKDTGKFGSAILLPRACFQMASLLWLRLSLRTVCGDLSRAAREAGLRFISARQVRRRPSLSGY